MLPRLKGLEIGGIRSLFHPAHGRFQFKTDHFHGACRAAHARTRGVGIGEREPAQRGLSLFRLNLEFRDIWSGRYYGLKQIVPVVAEESERIVIVTVYTFYFQEGDQR